MTFRLRFALFTLVFCFLLIIARLFYWQVVKAEELSYLGQSQYDAFIKISPKRGELKTSDGFPLVANKVTYLIFANPKEVKEKEKTAIKLSELLKVEYASMSALVKMDKFWVPIQSSVENDIKEAIEKEELVGIGFEQEATRFYPEASIAAHLIGFVGKDSIGDGKGYFGLEGYYDRQLHGKAGIAIQIQDALGRPILSRMNSRTSAIDGRSLVLSVDRAVQYLVEQKLKDGIERYGATGGMIGVMDPKTGNILAMVSYPSFDPGNYKDYDGQFYKNPFISNLYEPGSTFKPLVLSAAIDAKAVKPETKCPVCDKAVEIGEYKIKTWNDKYNPNTTMIDVIRNSDNTGMVYAGHKLGIEKLVAYLQKFGIGEQTGIDLQGEVSQPIRPAEEFYPIDAATITFGQGVSITPIELLVAFGAIANEGKRMEPHVVSKIETNDGQVITIAPKVVSTPISATTAKVMTEILVNAINKGEAKMAKTKGYRVAGKSGTAQIPIAGHYDPSSYVASFIGFAPADNPKFIMLVILDRPTSSIYGSNTAAPLFQEIAKHMLVYYNVPPSE